ncbi:ATP-binding cassette domain-containing protein [Lewinella sp. LCG006]|uniref:ATP-binding cassette domain-containing protein n=1 Tax=Lewinella sp. LCG006 TaxID=3231911 RepID=UPI00345F3E30
MKLQIAEASKSYGRRLLFKDLSLEIEIGEIVGLFGRNGSGKSTLLKMMFGVLGADSLVIKIDGRRVPAKKVIRDKVVAYLPQDRFLPNQMSVRNIIPMYYKDEETLDKVFYAPGISSFDKLKYGELSEGQKKYLEIVLLSHLDHPFMMLDEPFSMIDPNYKDLIKALLMKLKKTKGILVIDHYYQDILNISDRNYLLKNGALNEVEGEEALQKNGYLSNRMKKQ